MDQKLIWSISVFYERSLGLYFNFIGEASLLLALPLVVYTVLIYKKTDKNIVEILALFFPDKNQIKIDIVMNAISAIFSVLLSIFVGISTLFLILQITSRYEFSPIIPLSKSFYIILFSLYYLLVKDFISTFIHFLQHQVSFLSHFHLVHHSSTRLSIFAVNRVHFFEMLTSSFLKEILKTLFLLLFIFIFGDFSVVTYVQADIIAKICTGTVSLLRHSEARIHFPKFLTHFFLSPFMHQVHHSSKKEHLNKNYGHLFSFWDQFLFNSFYHPRIEEELNFGTGIKSWDNQIKNDSISLYKKIVFLVIEPIKRVF